MTISNGGASGIRVLVVAHQYWPVGGSATQRLSGVVAELVKQGATVTVVSHPLATGDTPEVKGPSDERVVRTRKPEGRGGVVLRIRSLVSFAVKVMTVGLRAKRFEVVLTDPPPTAAIAAWLVAQRHRAPLVYYVSDSWGSIAEQSQSRLVRKLAPVMFVVERFVMARSVLVVAATQSLFRIADKAAPGRTILRTNGVPLALFSPLGHSWAPSDRPFFLYAGNAGEAHGADIFVRAADRLWRAGLVFDVVYMGYGSGSAGIEEAAQRWPERVLRLGSSPPDHVAAAYRGAIGALSALRIAGAYADARPIKSMTGLACGCPAVYSGAGAFAGELRAHGLGFVSDWDVDDTADSMWAALDLAAKRPEEARVLRERCATYASANFDNAQTAREIAKRVVSFGSRL